MRTWSLDAPGSIDRLELKEVEPPLCQRGEVLVKMTAPGVVPFDSAIILEENESNFPTPVLPLRPGNQGAGVVEESKHPSFVRGQRVAFGGFAYGLLRPGSWAEYVAVDGKDLWPIPKRVSDSVASQAVVAYPTAYLALKEAGFKPGDTVLAPAIGGSVGNAVYQLAGSLGAGNVIATAGSAEKARKAEALGFERVIDLSRETIEEGVKRLNGGQGVDIVIDSLGGDILAQAVRCVRRYGVAITVGFSAGRITPLRQADLILNRVRLQGFGVYTSSHEDWSEAWSTFTRLTDSGRIAPVFDRSFAFDEASAALRYLIERRPFGAVSLEL